MSPETRRRRPATPVPHSTPQAPQHLRDARPLASRPERGPGTHRRGRRRLAADWLPHSWQDEGASGDGAAIRVLALTPRLKLTLRMSCTTTPTPKPDDARERPAGSAASPRRWHATYPPAEDLTASEEFAAPSRPSSREPERRAPWLRDGAGRRRRAASAARWPQGLVAGQQRPRAWTMRAAPPRRCSGGDITHVSV